MNKRAHNKSEAFIWKIFNIIPFILMVLCGINIFINHYTKSVDVETNTIISSEFEDYDKIIQEQDKISIMINDYTYSADSYDSLENCYISLNMTGSNTEFSRDEFAFRILSEDSIHKDYSITAFYYGLNGEYFGMFFQVYSYGDIVVDDLWWEDINLIYSKRLYDNHIINDIFLSCKEMIDYLAEDSELNYLLDNNYYFDILYGDFYRLDNNYIVTDEISFNYEDYSLPQQWIDTCDKYIFKGFNEAFNGRLYEPYDALVSAISVTNNSVYSLLKLLYSCCMWFLLIDIIQLCYYLIAFIPKKMCDYIGGK